MTLVSATLFGMPCLLMTLSLIIGRRLEAYPGKDDVWQLPKASSLR